MTTPFKVNRAVYDTLKVKCAAKINERMAALQLTPSAVQTITGKWAMELTEQYSISMADLSHYRSCRSLPRRGKLEVLAKVLKCAPHDLVPQRYQFHAKARVGRLVKGTSANGEFSTHVKMLPDAPGYAHLTIGVVLPAEVAHKISRQLADLHSYHDLRRQGFDDEAARGHLAAAKEVQEQAALGQPQ